MIIGTNEAISAIYYALWQGGYEYASLARDTAHMEALAAFRGDVKHPFFAHARQSTCEAYAFWPRAALLETAAFHVDRANACFTDFDELHRKIRTAPNVTDGERSADFWQWLADFPAALCEVLEHPGFKRYRAWAEEWVHMQNQRYKHELSRIEDCLMVCRERYDSPLKDVQVLIDPIKCVYSADYHVVGDTFVFSSGRFQAESVIHEYLHHVVHPAVVKYQEQVLRKPRQYPELDASYYAAGQLYAFEEHTVRQLTQLAMADHLPDKLDSFVQQLAR